MYIHDILVSGKENDDHLQKLNVVLSRLEEAGLKLKRSKCSFLLPSVEYLGYRITKDGLQPTSKKVEAVQKSPAPKDVSQLKSFIRLVNYYGKFLPDLSTVLAPLYRWLQKETEWRWTDEQQRAFEEVKLLIVYWSTTILTKSWCWRAMLRRMGSELTETLMDMNADSIRITQPCSCRTQLLPTGEGRPHYSVRGKTISCLIV